MLPIVYSYLNEDKRGRLEYIHSMNLKALEQVMQVEENEKLWLEAANAKRAILIQYELERKK